LAEVAPDLEIILLRGDPPPARFAPAEIRPETARVTMRDGVSLATDIYRPPVHHPAPTVVVRTPYGRAHPKFVEPCMTLACCGYVVVLQDCRGTGDSEPGSWDYYVYEREDSFDLVDWVTGQVWFDGFVAGCGGSYLGGTQWCMAMHPRMSTIVPEVCGIGIAPRTVRCHLLLEAYARSVGKGADKVPVGYDELERLIMKETLAGGYFNEPLHQPLSDALLAAYPHLTSLRAVDAKRWLWERYSSLAPAQRAQMIKQAVGTSNITVVDVEALSATFGSRIAPDAHLLPRLSDTAVLESLAAPALVVTGWYDWFLDDALATWSALRRAARESVSSRSRLLIAPSAHLMPGYHEGAAAHPELERVYRTQHIVDLLLRWYATVHEDNVDCWPVATYYLMGANEWRVASDWPPPDTQTQTWYLGDKGNLTLRKPSGASDPDRYTYDPVDPTPTIGGSIISFVYPTGSVDVSEVQKRADVLVYTTEPFECDLDVVGALKLIVYASSSAVDTDFAARISDVFPDGRAVQLQSSMLRARYRDPAGEPELLEPGRIYRFEIDLWATANRFERGHRLCLDICSADFPRFDRNTNRGGDAGPPLRAAQAVYHDPEHPSCLLIPVLPALPDAR
jgi:predicted acyl esterase